MSLMTQKKKISKEKMLVTAIQKGASVALACKYAGVARSTFYEWYKDKPEFAEAVDRAEGERALGFLNNIRRAGMRGKWEASAWMLERLHFETYGRRQAMELSGPGGGPMEVADAKSKLAEKLNQAFNTESAPDVDQQSHE